MGNLIREYFFERDSRGDPFWGYFFDRCSRENPFGGYFFEGESRRNPSLGYFFEGGGKVVHFLNGLIIEQFTNNEN